MALTESLEITQERVVSLRSHKNIALIQRNEIGPNHYEELYEVRGIVLPCGNFCSTPAKFLYFEKWHDGTVDIVTVCGEHALPSYFEILNNRTAG